MADCTQDFCAASSGEPVGTESGNALACNAGFIDQVANSQASSAINRVGEPRLTIKGLESQYIQTPLNGGIWAAGITFTAYNQYMIFNGVAYKPKSTTTLPYVSTATPDVNFVEPFSLSNQRTLVDVQTLSDGQLIVTFGAGDISLSVVQVYGDNVDGQYLIEGQDYDVDSPTQLTLKQSFPGGTELYLWQQDGIPAPSITSNAVIDTSTAVGPTVTDSLTDHETRITTNESNIQTNSDDIADLQSIRYSKLDNPLCHILKTNKLVDTLAPSNQVSDLIWTRATTATYIDRYGVVQTAAIDEPREEAEGWRIEGDSTNLVTFSEQFDNPAWPATRSSITPDADISPDGTLSADRLFDNTDNNSHLILQNYTYTPSTDYSLSCYAREGTLSQVAILASDGVLVFSTILDLVAGAVVSGSGNITALSNGWYRCDINFTTDPGAGAGNIQIRTAVAGNSIYVGTGTDYISIWGAQLEQLPFASRYIPTTTLSVTRARDDNSAAYYNNVPRGDQPFTIRFSGSIDGYTSFNRLFGTDTNNLQSRLLAFINSSGQIFLANGGDDSLAPTNPITFGQTFDYIITSDGTNYRSYLDGVHQSTSPVTNPATELDTFIKVLQGNSPGNDGYGNCLGFEVWSFELTQAEITFISGQ